jgi:site-specific DNA-methyltransferase (adenine-specific)
MFRILKDTGTIYLQMDTKINHWIRWIIVSSSDEGDLVADFYLGSGTTAVVCKELNRNFIGCDINPNAIEITKSRL